jgi:hypothetical protein
MDFVHWVWKETGTAPLLKTMHYQTRKVGAHDQQQESDDTIDMYWLDDGSDMSEDNEKGTEVEVNSEEEVDFANQTF